MEVLALIRGRRSHTDPIEPHRLIGVPAAPNLSTLSDEKVRLMEEMRGNSEVKFVALVSPAAGRSSETKAAFRLLLREHPIRSASFGNNFFSINFFPVNFNHSWLIHMVQMAAGIVQNKKENTRHNVEKREDVLTPFNTTV